jgi:hypothetical protein
MYPRTIAWLIYANASSVGSTKAPTAQQKIPRPNARPVNNLVFTEDRPRRGGKAMSEHRLWAIGAAVALGVITVGSTLAVAQFNPWNNNNVNMRSMTDNWGEPSALGALASNEGIFVDVKEFKIAKGAAKGDANDQIAKSGAREVTDGAVIFRSGNKLYIADGKPASK